MGRKKSTNKDTGNLNTNPVTKVKCKWTEEENTVMIDELHVQKDSRRQAQSEWKPGVWKIVKEYLEQDVGVSDPPKTEEKCQDHWTSKLKKDWCNVYSLSTQSGFSFCTITYQILATPDVWEPLLKPPAATESQPVSEDTAQSPPTAPVTTALTGASAQPLSTTHNSPTADGDNESDSDDSSPATGTPRNVPGSSKMSSGPCCGHHLCGPEAVSDVASALQLLTLLLKPSLSKSSQEETAAEEPKTKKTLTPKFTTFGTEEEDFRLSSSEKTFTKEESFTSDTFSRSPKETDPFQKLLEALKKSPILKTLKIKMSKDKRLSGSKPKMEPKLEETTIGSTVQLNDNKEIKAALPTLFMGDRKETKRFILKVQLYVALNLKAFKTDKLKELFMLSYVQGGLVWFWKLEKAKEILVEEDSAKIPAWKDFIKDFKESFGPLDVELNMQMKL
ncbi:hypothetical protein WG66_015019 [Moniliophthora roreri]|nr:hypothetical protein WG66_015019 [Moniliophthora roreri]